MRIVFTKQPLQEKTEIDVYAPTAQVNEDVKFCLPSDTLGWSPLAYGVCAGPVPKTISTPKRHGFLANPHREYKRFIVTRMT